jgi:glycosyltransferase involved in cell wall biosynthesis
MNVERPRIVIGLPVYNGEKYLRYAIESILGQTFSDFRLLISDNASTDATSDICREYAKSDRRIVYHRQSKNIGGAANFNYVFQPESSPYFKWAAHDDIIKADFLRACVDRLDREPMLAIAHSRSYKIDEQGNKVGTYDRDLRMNGLRPRDRFWRVLWAGHFTEVFGVMRADLVAKTQLFRNYVGSDRNFLMDMLLQGDLGYVEEHLFCRRDSADCLSHSISQNKNTRLQWFGTNAQKMDRLVGLIKFKDYCASIVRMPIGLGDRLACLRMLAEWGIRRGIESGTGSGERYREKLLAQSTTLKF